jgi:fatty acid CoA ligase FadD9
MLAILGPYRRPQTPGAGSRLPAVNFHVGTQAAGLEIPHLSPGLIHKYLADLRGLGLL